MPKYLIILILIPSLYSQSIPQKFFDALIYNKSEITDYINKDELNYSNRLGISYDSVKNKILIGYELPDEIKSGILSGKYKYEIIEQPLADTYTEVTVSVPDANYSRKYFFSEGFVTNSTYYSWQWKKNESKYFTYRLEEPKYFNDYCIKRLDQFVDMIADTLGFTISEKRILEKEKIGYIFCKDEESVEKITGFKAKGMAMLGSDVVVTSYQTHFHEVAHILINYKLKKLGLYTLPFFMEGFAVAVGGRGGMAPRVVTDLGYYLQKSGILTYDSIITNDGFYSNDASMCYAVAGLYNSFLLSELGGGKYLELYKRVNGSLEKIKQINSANLKISEIELFNDYLIQYGNNSIMQVDSLDKSEPNSYVKGIFGYCIPIGKYYKFYIIKDLLIGPIENEVKNDYNSKLLFEFSKEKNNNPLKYYLTVDNSFLKIYNLYNDEMIYSYNENLSELNIKIPVIKGFGGDYFTFFILKDYLNNDFTKGFTVMGSTR